MHVIVLILTLIPGTIFAGSLKLKYQEAVDLIKGSIDLKSLDSKIKAIESEGEKKGSWGNPQIRIGANNLPAETLRADQTPMSNYAVELSQKIPLSFKYSHLEDSFKSQAQAVGELKKDKEREKIAKILSLFVEKNKVLEDINIHETNIKWLENIIKVSNKLYTTGKIPQLALLSLKIRLSKLQSQHARHFIMLDQIDAMAREVLNLEEYKNISLLPKGIESLNLNIKTNSKSAVKSPKLKAMQAQLNSSEAFKKHSNSNSIPDIRVGAQYHFRENIDGNGNFISGFVAFDLPIGSTTHSQVKEANAKLIMAERNYTSYKRGLEDALKVIELDIKSNSKQLKILKSDSLKLAKLSRQVANKNYSLGNASYRDLLDAEFEYQDILTKINELEANLKKRKIEYLYKSGDNLL